MGSTPTSGTLQVDYINKPPFSKPLSQGLVFQLRAGWAAMRESASFNDPSYANVESSA